MTRNDDNRSDFGVNGEMRRERGGEVDCSNRAGSDTGLRRPAEVMADEGNCTREESGGRVLLERANEPEERADTASVNRTQSSKIASVC